MKWLKPIKAGQATGAPSREEPVGDPADEASISWTVFLLAKHPRRGALALLVILFTTWFTWDFTGSSWMAGVAAFVLVASLSNFFFPTRFRIDGESVRISNLFYRRTRRWSEFRQLRRQGGRLKLLTLPHESRLDNFRGMLLFLPEESDAILSFVRERLERDGTA